MYSKTFLTGILVIVSFLSIPASSFGINAFFDLTTTAQEGSLTEGHLNINFNKQMGARLDFLEERTLIDSEVAGTELSTQFSKNTRRQIDLLFSHVLPDRWDIFGTIYGGISFIQFSENQKSTYVVVDTVGEYGTDYAQDRTSSFFSPRVGLKLNNISGSKQRLLSSLNYELTFSPVYYIIMNQKLTYNTVDGNEDEYTNELYRWSSPYIDHRLEIRVNKYLRTSIYHSFMYLSYSTLQLADNGWDVYAVDDPTYINVLRVNFDFTMPLGEIVTFNIGAGYQWTYTRRTSNRIPESLNKTTTKNPYIRIGSTLLDY